MQIDLRAAAYPSLLEAIGLAIMHCDLMEGCIPRVFQAALRSSPVFRQEVFEATRGIEVHLKLTSAAIREGAPNFVDRWSDIAARVRSSASLRGSVAHAGLSVSGAGIIVELDEDGNPTGIARRAGPPVASLYKQTKEGMKLTSEAEIRELADRLLSIANELTELAKDIVGSR